jgi:hypothetical protein
MKTAVYSNYGDCAKAETSGAQAIRTGVYKSRIYLKILGSRWMTRNRSILKNEKIQGNRVKYFSASMIAIAQSWFGVLFRQRQF